MYFANSLDDLKSFLAQAKAGFVIDKISLGDMPDWVLRDGALSHKSGGFFSLVGVAPTDRPAEQKLMLYQPQSALTGLLTTVQQGERFYLLQARAEPGNCGIAQFGPTIQSTPANYLRLHGGNTSPYVDWFTTFKPSISVMHDSMQLDLGERYLFKSKRLLVVHCPPNVPLAQGFIWVPARLLAQATCEPTFLNTDLRSLINVCGWCDEDPQGLHPLAEWVRHSLQQNTRPEKFAEIATGMAVGPQHYRFVPLDQLSGWQLSDAGLRELQLQQGFDVEYYRVEAVGREVRSWSQPLINSHSIGLVALACRVNNGTFECAVRLAAETGLQNGRALLPTLMRYPGEPKSGKSLSGQRLVQTTESDEGGRFYQDASVYEVVMTDSPLANGDPSLIWLSVSELRAILRQSNMCSIQLRGVASLLLGTAHASFAQTMEQELPNRDAA